MSFKTISEVVELAVSEAGLFEKIGNEASQGDWIDTATDSFQLARDVALKLVPAHELDKPLDVPSQVLMANDIAGKIAHALHEAAAGGNLSIRSLLKSLDALALSFQEHKPK